MAERLHEKTLKPKEKNHLLFASQTEKVNKKHTWEARRTRWRLEIARVRPRG